MSEAEEGHSQEKTTVPETIDFNMKIPPLQRFKVTYGPLGYCFGSEIMERKTQLQYMINWKLKWIDQTKIVFLGREKIKEQMMNVNCGYDIQSMKPLLYF